MDLKQMRARCRVVLGLKDDRLISFENVAAEIVAPKTKKFRKLVSDFNAFDREIGRKKIHEVLIGEDPHLIILAILIVLESFYAANQRYEHPYKGSGGWREANATLLQRWGNVALWLLDMEHFRLPVGVERAGLARLLMRLLVTPSLFAELENELLIATSLIAAQLEISPALLSSAVRYTRPMEVNELGDLFKVGRILMGKRLRAGEIKGAMKIGRRWQIPVTQVPTEPNNV